VQQVRLGTPVRGSSLSGMHSCVRVLHLRCEWLLLRRYMHHHMGRMWSCVHILRSTYVCMYRYLHTRGWGEAVELVSLSSCPTFVCSEVMCEATLYFFLHSARGLHVV